ncbi:MAG TPA: hypothetical protein VKI01_04045 [Acidimicrobiia bacterium]|nr:hypothetical protein [Acidimicrobiia bacterium]
MNDTRCASGELPTPLATPDSSRSVVYAYVVSPAPLEWHLLTSADRTTIALRLLLLAEAFVRGSAAVAALRQDAARARPTLTPWSARASSSTSPELSP